jgi:peptide/nickel transport system substrate-binding protein
MRKFRTKQAGALALAVAGVTVIAACSSSGSSSGSSTSTNGSTTQEGAIGAIPAAGTPSGKAGSITYGFLSADAPNWILPIITAADNSVYNSFDFEWEMWRPLYFTPQGSTPTVDQTLSVADPPVFSNGDKTFSITLKPWKWSNGATLSSKDLEFTLDEVKAAVKESPANWADYTPGYFPDTISSMSTTSASTLTVNLSKPVNPTWLEEDIIDIPIMPSDSWAKDSANGAQLDYTNAANATKIYNFLSTQAKSVNTYATNPLWQDVYGPYKLSSFNATTGGFTMVPNPTYSGPHAAVVSNFVGVPYTSDAAEFNAIKAGAIDVDVVPPEDAPELSSLKALGYAYFGLPDFGNYFAAYNFQDKTGDFNNIVAQLYFRQAMQHVEDQQGQIKAYLNGAGSPDYTVISLYPKSPFLPASSSNNPYPFSVSEASSLLTANGWNVVPNGVDTCAKPGTATGECGAGIPAGTKLSFNLVYNTTAPYTQEDEDLASNAKAAGIQINLQGSNFDYIISNYNDAASPANEGKWAMEDFGGESMSTYPTSFGLFNTNGSGQLGNYSNPTSDSLINDSISSANPNAVSAELSFYETNLPVLWQPTRDHIYAWKTSISGSDPNAFEILTQYGSTPEMWYVNK